jgi:hypothetical protein
LSLTQYKTKTAASKLVVDMEECINNQNTATIPLLDNVATVPVDEENNMADEVKTAVAFNKLLTDLKAKGYMAKD